MHKYALPTAYADSDGLTGMITAVGGTEFVARGLDEASGQSENHARQEVATGSITHHPYYKFITLLDRILNGLKCCCPGIKYKMMRVIEPC